MDQLKTKISDVIHRISYVVSYKLNENIQSAYKTDLFIAICCMIIVGITTLLNIKKSTFAMTLTTSLLFIAFFIAAILSYMQRGMTFIKISISTIICIIFSYYVIIGGNEGFAALWILLIPFTLMTLWGFTFAIAYSLYFLIMLSAVFWTPIGAQLLQYQYTVSFSNRFPILYCLALILAIIINYQNKALKIHKENEQRLLEEAVQREHNRVKDLALQSITAISQTVEAKDSYTRKHSTRVAEYSLLIANELGWSDKEKRNLYQAALLHDIGKIGISDTVLNKTSRLTDEEYTIMKTHTTIGGDILSNMTLMNGLTNGAYYHHERFDGKGYPYGLKGEQIPIESRIIGLADSIDAITSDRVYRKGRNLDYLLNELQRGKATQFDPDLTELFIKIIERGDFKIDQ